MNGKIKIIGVIKLCGLFLFCLFIFISTLYLYRSNKLSFIANAINSDSGSAKVLIVGDIMLDRNVRNTINNIGFDKYFSGVKDLIQEADLSVGNLEGPFTDYESLTASLKNKVLQFTFDPKNASKLAELGFDVLGLANNHTYNFGKDGLNSTREYLNNAGIRYYGDPFNKEEISIIINKNNLKIALIGFHEFYYTNFDKVYSEINKLRNEADVVIVTPHWGVEYQKEPTQKMKEWAHLFIDSGADAVIGTHPHIIGNTEVYKGKKIYYSLGNFAFDQYFSKATMKGLAVLIDIEKTNYIVDLNFKDILIDVKRDGISLDKTN